MIFKHFFNFCDSDCESQYEGQKSKWEGLIRIFLYHILSLFTSVYQQIYLGIFYPLVVTIQISHCTQDYTDILKTIGPIQTKIDTKAIWNWCQTICEVWNSRLSLCCIHFPVKVNNRKCSELTHPPKENNEDIDTKSLDINSINN